jgi:hypothetical protein
MEVIEKTLIYVRSEGEFRLYPIGDSHIGTKHCTESDLQKIITEIKDNPQAIWIGMGDYGEFITPSDKRWDSKSIADWLIGKQDNVAEEQTKRLVELFSPIVDKCIGLLEGNHEDAIRRFLHTDVQTNLCDRLKLPNLGYSTWVKLRFSRENSNEHHVYKCVFSHGSGWAITPGAKMNRLQRFMSAFDARIYGMGHMHDIITHTVPYLELSDANIIKQKERVGAITGCWFKTYSQGVSASYGEKKNYPPTSLGCPKFVIIPTKDEVRVEG